MDFKYHICSISYFFAMCYDNYTFSHFMRTFHQYLNNFVCNFFIQKFNRENGVTVVMISSELEELRTTCDRIAIVSGGRIVGILPATESSETFGALMVSQVK